MGLIVTYVLNLKMNVNLDLTKLLSKIDLMNKGSYLKLTNVRSLCEAWQSHYPLRNLGHQYLSVTHDCPKETKWNFH